MFYSYLVETEAKQRTNNSGNINLL